MTNEKLASGVTGEPGSFAGDTERLHFAMKVSGIGIWEVDLQNNTVIWDERCRELYGISGSGPLALEEAFLLIYPDDRPRVEAAVLAALNGADAGRYDLQYRTLGGAAGQARWVRFSGQAFFDAEGRPVRFGGIAQDITALMQSIQQADESSKLAEVAMEGAGAGSFRILLASDKMEYSPSFARLFTGNEHANLTREAFLTRLLPEDRPVREAAYRIAEQTGKLNYEARSLWDDGSIHWFQAAGAYINDPTGKPYLFTGTIRDITAEVTRQQRLQFEEARFRDVVEQAPLAIGLLRGRSLVIELGNEPIFRLWGKPASITGKPLLEALPELEAQAFIKLLEEVFDTGIPYTGSGVLARIEQQGKREDLYFDFTYTPLRNTDGAVTGVMILGSEVTARVLARRAIEESERRFRSLVENTPDIITRWNNRLHLLFANNSLARRTGLLPENITGLPLSEMGLPDATMESFREALQQTFATGKLQEHYSTLPSGNTLATYQSRMVPEADADGVVESVLSISRDITELKRSEERLRSIITAAPAGICLFIGRELVIRYPNQTIIDMMGKGAGIEGQPLREAMPELASEEQPFLKILDDVYTTGKAFQSFGSQVKVVKNGVMTAGYYNITYTPLFDEEHSVYGILEIAIDVTDQVETLQKLDNAQQSLEMALQIGKLGNFMIDLKTGRVSYSPPIAGWFGLDGTPQPLPEIFTRIHPQDVPWVIEEVGATITGKNNGKHDFVYRVINPLTGTLYHLHAMGQVQENEGVPVSVTGIIQDVTAQTVATEKLEASESRLRSLVESAPFPIGVYTGREMRIRLANQTILDIWGKGNDVIGQLYSDILPELENQQIFGQLDQVFTTGIPFHNRNQRLDLVVNNRVTTFYFNYSFTPLFDTEGNVYGVMNTAADVTDLALAIQRAEKAEAAVLSAIELAALGTWTLNPLSGVIAFSPRIREWFGLFIDEANQEVLYRQIHDKDRERVVNAIYQAMELGSEGLYDEEFTVIAKNTGRERILHAQGKTVFDENNRPVRLSGSIQDVTINRQMQLELENEVQQRTEELAASNEELRVTNDELGMLNQLLTRSNEELAQYAYVASHDLQEPLRKIRMFAGMLSNEKNLLPTLVPLVQKIDRSAERMALLIRDLLDFSRLLKSDSLARPVDLNEIVHNVVNDFELLIEEKKAQVKTRQLPEVEAIALQMNQLFYNLVSNALKFSRPGVSPVIEIGSELVTLEQVKQYVGKPFPFAQYHHITVKDNGIGFETKFAEHIFEVFKRLHARELFPGSGIGLAMCRRIADNHNGRLFAESVQGEGSVFHLYLPSKQQNYETDLPAGFHWIND